MSTSLAEQLRRLAVPQTKVLQRDKKRPSLLFDPKEAANLTRETVYQIGIDGLEELKLKDPSFAQFEDTLFGVTSKEFERSVQNSKANTQLNKNIRRFILRLTPYFLYNCSHKALEWLINRYYVHEYNKEDLLMLIFPYHETNVFVRVLQLLNLREPSDKWRWLKPLQKPGIHLPKQTLYNHAASDVYFLKFVTEFIFSIINEHENPNSLPVAFNYYCVTFTGALEYCSEINEAQVSQMLPLILKGLNSEIPDFAAASYIITAKLMLKAELSDKVLKKIVNKISQMKVANLKMEATLLLIILYQAQKQLSYMPHSAIVHLAEKKTIPKILQDLNNKGNNIYPFLSVLFKDMLELMSIQQVGDDIFNFAEELMSQIKLDESFVASLLNITLDAYKPKCPKTTRKWSKKFFSTIERQYPESFDRGIRNVMKAASEPLWSKRQKNLRRILNTSTSLQGIFEAFEKIYHPNSELRIEGVEHLCKNYDNFREKDKEMLRNAILDRINDENSQVIIKTLRWFKDKLLEIVDRDVLKFTLIKLLGKSQNDKENYWKVSYVALNILCTHFKSDVETFLAVLPFLLPTSPGEMKAARMIINSDYVEDCEFLKSLKTNLEKATTQDKFFAVFYDGLSMNEHNFDLLSVVEVLKKEPEENRNALHKYLVMLFLTSLMSENSTLDTSYLILEIFVTYMETSKAVLVYQEPTACNFILLARKGKLPLQGVLNCLENLILKTHTTDTKLSVLDLNADVEQSKFYVHLLKILLKGCASKKQEVCASYTRGVKIFFKHFCCDFLSTIECYLNFAVADIFDSKMQLQCLQNVKYLLAKTQENLAKFVAFENVFVPYIITTLSNPSLEFRKVAADIVEIILNILGPKLTNCYLPLLVSIFKNKKEIVMDHEQVPFVLGKSLNDYKNFSKTLDAILNLIHDEKYPGYLHSSLLKLLVGVNDIKSFSKTARAALKILRDCDSELSKTQSDIVHSNLNRFDSDIAGKLAFNTSVWELIELSVKDDDARLKADGCDPISPACVVLDRIDHDFFNNLKPAVQAVLLNLVIEVAANTQNPNVLQSANRVFRRIDLDANLVLEQLKSMCDVQSPKQSNLRRTRRVSVVPTVDIIDTNEWKKGIAVLEFMQDKKKIRNIPVLFPMLFGILKKCLDFDEQSHVEYPKQLVLSCILHCCDKLEDKTLPKNVFNIELVVQCIRASQNPQTHHHALLVLAHTAPMIPDQVLHHIIAVFTFMGSSVLRHDDAYSFQIITKIIDTIIPILVQDKSVKNVANVVRVFVDAILDVPEHRRTPLFKLLLTRLDPKENLFLFLLLVFEAHVVHGHTEKKKVNPQLRDYDVPKRLDVSANLCREFPPDVVLGTCIKLLQYLRQLPEEKNDYVPDGSNYTFHIHHHNAKQFRHYKYTLVTFVANLLASKEFVNQMASLSDSSMQALENDLKSLIINILTYIQTASKTVDKHCNTPQAQYWKVMLHHSYDALDSINALVTSQMFLLVIRGLMVHSLYSVRRRSLELLNTKLQNDSSFFEDCEESKLHALISPLVGIVKSVRGVNLESEQEMIIQTALLSLKLLVKQLAPSNPEKFVQLLDFISDLVKSGVEQENILASIVLCLAELCSNLRAHAISSLSKFMPAVIKILKKQKHESTPNLLLLSVLTAFVKIFDSLSLFLSPYLEKLLYELSSLISIWDMNVQDQKSAPFVAKLQTIRKKIGSVVPSRVLIPAVESCYTSLIAKNKYNSVGPVMGILSENLNDLRGPQLQANLPALMDFFLNALQFRSNGNCTFEQANLVESHVIQAMVALVLKLSESSFRPLYYRLFDWAVRTDGKSERVITFYNLSNGVANCLKGLFILFAGHFLNNAATLLDTCNKTKNKELYFDEDEKNILLLEQILQTLQAVFLYDSRRFVTKERFDVLMQPLVDQLENDLGEAESFEKRAKTIIIPCIVQFAVATADDALWKQLNYQILLKTRSDSAVIRLTALECLKETAKQLGEDFLPLLPETIPFLAELLEDEEETVEKNCRKTVQELEKVFGESLQKYF